MNELLLDGTSWESNTPRLQAALHHTRGGTLYVRTPAEGAEIGFTQIPDHVVLHVVGGSTLLAALDREAYEGSEYDCLIESRGTQGAGIVGRGTIDGRGLEFMEEDLRYIYRPREWRPRLIFFLAATDVAIRDITLRNAPNWTLHLTGCDRVNIDGVTIDNDLKIPNCDGIDPDRCRDVRISNCAISCADDCIVIKNTKAFPEHGETRRITVTGCTLVSTSAAIKIGTESTADFSDIVVTGCTITDSSRGIALQLRDQGNIERVIISDCTITTRLFEEHYWGRAEPISITALPRLRNESGAEQPVKEQSAVGTIRDLTISNIRALGENGVVVYGVRREDGSVSVQDISLHHLNLTVARRTSWEAGRRDLRPCDALGPAFRDPSEDPGLEDLPFYAISVEGTRRLSIRDVAIDWRVNELDGYGTPLYVRQNDSLTVDGIRISEQGSDHARRQ